MFIFLLIAQILVTADIQSEVERHIEMGKKFLSQGQFADALTHYHAAIELDPTNYMTYYRRATVLLATGKVKAALPDLDRVVELKQDFIAVRVLAVAYSEKFRGPKQKLFIFWILGFPSLGTSMTLMDNLKNCHF